MEDQRTQGDIIEEIADAVGGEIIKDYSGRAMMGRTCLGMTCAEPAEAIKMAGKLGLHGGRHDSCGKTYIAYWPGVADGCAPHNPPRAIDPNEPKLKRDNWTNAEVRRILALEKIEARPGHYEPEFIKLHNDAIDQAIGRFHDFERNPEDPKEYGAMAFNTHTQHVDHIGTLPPQ